MAVIRQSSGRHFFTLSECLSNVLITGESNFDERNGQEMFNWSELHSDRNNFLKNPYFSSSAKKTIDKIALGQKSGMVNKRAVGRIP